MTTKAQALKAQAAATATEVRETAAQAKRRVAKAAEEAKDVALEEGTTLLSDVRDRAVETLGVARDAVAARADKAKAAVADAGSRLADGLRSAASDADGNSLQSRSLTMIAGGLQDVARGLNGQSLSTIVTDARDFARRNPALCVAGAAVAGFALIRLLRASNVPQLADAADDAPAPRAATRRRTIPAATAS